MPTPQPGPVMLDIEGVSLTALDQEKLAHPNTGGVILFTRNYEEPAQLAALTQSIRQARRGPLLIAVDHEGGRVQRFHAGFTRLPPAAAYTEFPGLAESAGWLMAAELLACGLDFSFAPVLDIDYGVSEIIGDRAFAAGPEQTAALALAFMRGMRAAGMASVGKHFPGHGGVGPDSHLTLPVDERSLNDIRAGDLIPFRRLIDAGLDAIMPAHVLYPQIDPLPAGFSSMWLQQILRRELEFQGAILSDDLNMAGADCAGDYPQRAELALQAGCDMILICNNPAAAEQILDRLPQIPSPERAERLRRLGQRAPAISRAELHASPEWRRIATSLANLSPAHA